MISWIQRTFQHHFKIIFGIILAVTVLSFIFTIGSTPGVGRADHKEVVQDFFGHNLASQQEKQKIADDAQLSAALRFATRMEADQVQFYAFQRLTALHLADQMHIPSPGPVELRDYIQSLRMFQGSDGQFDAARYESFRASVASSTTGSAQDVARVLAEDVRVSKVERLLGGPGYVLPSEVAEVIAKSDTTWTVSTATLAYATYDPGIRLSDAEVGTFFSENAFRYTVGPLVSVDSVSFSAEAYLAGVTPSDAEVRDYYDANPSRFPAPAAAKAPAAKPDDASRYAAVQAQVRTALRLELAKREATKAASDFAYGLYDGKVEAGAPLQAYLEAHKLKAVTLAPFTAEAGPAELAGSREAAQAAFELNAKRYFSEAIPTPSGAVVLIWRASMPSRQPLLAEVRAKVVADATEAEKRRRFIDLGQRISAALQHGIKDGQTFERAAAAAPGGVKLEVKSFPPFTLRSQPPDLDPTVSAVLDHLAKGAVSDMQATPDKGIFVYAADKKVPALDPSNPRVAQVWRQLSLGYAQTESVGILSGISEAEVKRMDAALK